MKLKAFITSLTQERKYPEFTKCGYTHHTFMNSIHKYGDLIYSDLESADIVCVFVTFSGDDCTFDEYTSELISKTNKPIIIFDYNEYGTHNGGNRINEYNLFGYQLEFNDLNIYNYSSKMHRFLSDNHKLITCYFKRELGTAVDLTKVPFKVYPLEFIADEYTTKVAADTKDQYYDRKCIYNFVWGFSNFSRPHLNGTFLLNMEKFNCKFALSHKQTTYMLNESTDKFIFITNHDWRERVDLNFINSKSMMILDLYGCGLKCFRNVESSKNSLSVKQDPSQVKYTYEWKDGYNCISLPVNDDMSLNIDKSIKTLLDYRHDKHHLLYDMYLNSVEINKLYAPSHYVPNHLIKNIKSAI
jgi:hypothetical protein